MGYKDALMNLEHPVPETPGCGRTVTVQINQYPVVALLRLLLMYIHL